MNNILKTISLFFTFGIVIAWFSVPIKVSILLVLLINFLFLAYLRYSEKKSFQEIIKYFLFSTLCFALGLANTLIHHKLANTPNHQIRCLIADQKFDRVCGLVLEMPKQGLYGSNSLIIDIHNSNKSTFNLKGKAQVKLQRLSSLPTLGDEICFRGKFAMEIYSPELFAFSLSKTSNKYLRSQGIKFKFTNAEIFDIQKSQSLAGQILSSIAAIQIRLISIHKVLLPGDQVSLMQAMLIGRSTGTPLSKEIWTLGSNLGVNHIFAASALNLTALIFFLTYLLNLFKIPHRSKIIILLAFITFYACLAGFIPSIMRAWFMASVVLIGQLLKRRANLLNTLLLALCISLLFDPNLIGDLGFQFSYLATLGIILWTEKLIHWMKFIPYSWAEPIAVSITAQALILPIKLWYFHNLPIYSILANLLAVPLASLILICGLLASLFSLFGSIGWIIASICDFAGSQAIHILDIWLHILGGLPGANLKIQNISFPWVLWLYLAVIGIGFFSKFKLTKHILISSGITLLLLSCISTNTHELIIQSISKRWYELVILTTPNKQTIIICNQANESNISEKLVKDLHKSSVKHIDWWIGNCMKPEGMEISRLWRIKNKNLQDTNEVNIEKDLKLKLSVNGVLIDYKAFKGLILFTPLSDTDNETNRNNNSRFYSLIKFAFNSEVSKRAIWSEMPKAEYCLLPHSEKTFRKEILGHLKNSCDKSYEQITLKNKLIKSDGVFITIQ
ncbi:MAG: ComEC/Rec2 family competence protein [Candidatus Melainabacteria bacterium]|jgi:ComEC/Rec2-related protein